MNRDEVTRMAREAGIKNDCDGIWCDADQLIHFAALVAAAERERIKQANAPEIEKVNAHIKMLEGVLRSDANAIQHGGTHYKEAGIEPWDYIAANNLGYFEGNIVKYVSRWKHKNGVEDLRKAQHYLQKLIELTEAK